jgi:hypothetical protein
MFILIEHTITDPASFWGKAEELTSKIPRGIQLHHSFPTKDGTRAACLWEADSVSAVRDFLEPIVGRVSRNEYFEVMNKDGVGMPTSIRTARAGV